MTRLHLLSLKDQAAVAEMAVQSAPFKGMMTGPEARVPYDAMIAATPAATGITSEAASVGGVAGY